MKERRRGRRTDNKRRDAVSQGRHKRRKNVDEGEMRMEKGETSAEKRQKIPRHIGAVEQTTNDKRHGRRFRGISVRWTKRQTTNDEQRTTGEKIPRHIGAVDQTTNNKRRTTNDRGEVSAAYRCCGPNDKRQGAIKQ